MMKITSIKDPIVCEARQLQSAGYRKESGKILLFGLEQVEWALRARIGIERVFVENDKGDALLPLGYKGQIIEVSSGILKKISGTNYLVPVLGVGRLQPPPQVEADFVVVMDRLQDFGNIGSIIRSAKGFAVDQFLFSSMPADPYQRKVIDASRGMVFESAILQMASGIDTIRYLKERDYQIVVTSPHARNLQSQVPLSTKKVALIVGNETEGAGDEFLETADVSIQIPMSLSVESLNASVSAGISIYELKFKQVLMMLKQKIFADFGRQVDVTGKMIRMAFDREIKQCTDLSGMQVILMMIMRCDGRMSAGQVARDIALFGDDFENFLAPLTEKNYVARAGDDYSLTETGERFLAEIWPVAERTHQKILSEMTAEETEQLKRLLSKVQQGCMKILEGNNRAPSI